LETLRRKNYGRGNVFRLAETDEVTQHASVGMDGFGSTGQRELVARAHPTPLYKENRIEAGGYQKVGNGRTGGIAASDVRHPSAAG
jgi:hypothetical protein